MDWIVFDIEGGMKVLSSLECTWEHLGTKKSLKCIHATHSILDEYDPSPIF